MQKPDQRPTIQQRIAQRAARKEEMSHLIQEARAKRAKEEEIIRQHRITQIEKNLARFKGGCTSCNGAKIELLKRQLSELKASQQK
jgi:hypothetical protein